LKVVSSSKAITLFRLIRIYWRNISTLILINSLFCKNWFEVYRFFRSEEERIFT
jgi:hypothetical protein